MSAVQEFVNQNLGNEFVVGYVALVMTGSALALPTLIRRHREAGQQIVEQAMQQQVQEPESPEQTT